jgi:formamidopyrimidine-DNA glycosylase
MPELPEVETVVRGLRSPLIGRVAGGLWYDWGKTLRTPDPESFAARIAGQTFRAVERRAKYILCKLDDDILVVHLKMTGRLYVTPAGAIHDADRWVHFRLDLDSGQELRFSDARKFGFVALVTSLDELTVDLGPEPLEDDFTLPYMREQLKRYGRAIKAVLLDQAFVAGVGNIYADEALWRAKIHPMTPAKTLNPAAVKRLHGTIRAVLAAGVEYEGASINWYRKPDGTSGEAQNHFSAYDHTGEPCPRCGTPIEKIRVAGRGTHYCPRCQRL